MNGFSFSKLSGRERRIAYATLGIAAVFLLYQGVISPFVEARAAVMDKFRVAQNNYRSDMVAIANRKQMERDWNDYLNRGLKSDAAAAEAQVQHALREWESAAGVSLTALQPERAVADVHDAHFQTMTFQVAGTGSELSIARFIHGIETADLPLRISRLRISDRGREGVDDLQFTTTIYALLLAPALDKTRQPAIGTGSSEAP